MILHPDGSGNGVGLHNASCWSPSSGKACRQAKRALGSVGDSVNDLDTNVVKRWHIYFQDLCPTGSHRQ